MSEIVEFLETRIGHREVKARLENDLETLADCAMQRAILETHKNWPVLVAGPTYVDSLDDFKFHATQEILWFTQKEYIRRFGTEPATAPIILIMARRYSGHPSFNSQWAV